MKKFSQGHAGQAVCDNCRDLYPGRADMELMIAEVPQPGDPDFIDYDD